MPYSTNLLSYFCNSQLFYYVLTDKKGFFIYSNPLFQKRLGDTGSDKSIASIKSLFINANKCFETIEKCFENPGTIISTQLITRSKTDNIIITNWEFSACINNEDQDLCIQAIGIVATEQEQNILHANLFNGITDAIFSCDKELNIISWNKGAEEIYGIESKEVLGKKIMDLPHITYDQTSWDEVIKTIYDKDTWNGEISFTRRSDQTTRTLLATATLLYDEENNPERLLFVNKDITAQKKLLQQQVELEIQKQRQLIQTTIDKQEKERLAIGKELHDNISQRLSITRLYLEVVKEKEPAEVQEIIEYAHKNISGIINKIRQLSQSLVPPTLGDIGLIESIEEVCESLRLSHSFNIDFFHRHFKEEILQDNLKLMLFRIFQEQVSNIIRHSQADSIEIRLLSDAEFIMLIITDNGRGFDSFNYTTGKGFSDISSRAGLFNGKVEIDSGPGRGCTLSVAIPSVATGWEMMN
ncbi:MAG: PAS domain S-box protein [Bacteroidota bacterium]